MPAPIALITDFGLDDPYVGQIRGVLAGRAPAHGVIDLSHAVRPFCLFQAGFMVASSIRHFPPGTVFVAVVDPGVGTERGVLAACWQGRTILSPDNGLLELPLQLLDDVKIFDLSGSANELALMASATFHGRDVFAPLAARLMHEAVSEFGPKIVADRIVRDPDLHLKRLDSALPDPVSCRILHVDRFGNCALGLLPGTANITRVEMLSPLQLPVVVARTFANLGPNQVGMIVGSHGFYELIMNQDSLARTLGLDIGQPVTLKIQLEGE